jgi:hypothetical protein
MRGVGAGWRHVEELAEALTDLVERGALAREAVVHQQSQHPGYCPLPQAGLTDLPPDAPPPPPPPPRGV